MSQVPWYGCIPFYFHISSISTSMLTYYSFSLYFYICIYYTQLTDHATHRGFIMMFDSYFVFNLLALTTKNKKFPHSSDLAEPSWFEHPSSLQQLHCLSLYIIYLPLILPHLASSCLTLTPHLVLPLLLTSLHPPLLCSNGCCFSSCIPAVLTICKPSCTKLHSLACFLPHH